MRHQITATYYPAKGGMQATLAWTCHVHVEAGLLMLNKVPDNIIKIGTDECEKIISGTGR